MTDHSTGYKATVGFQVDLMTLAAQEAGPAGHSKNMSQIKALFETMHKEYHPMVQQMCLGFVKGDEMLSNDLAQEVFINVWNALDKFRAESSPKTWLYRITVNTCLQHIRKEKNKHHVPISEQELVTGSDSADPEHRELYKAIGQLNEVDRLVIMMVLDELKYEEIAGITGISETNLRVKIHRIKQKLKKLLEDERRAG